MAELAHVFGETSQDASRLPFGHHLLCANKYRCVLLEIDDSYKLLFDDGTSTYPAALSLFQIVDSSALAHDIEAGRLNVKQTGRQTTCPTNRQAGRQAKKCLSKK
jgi:hypothetical protein